ncbi:hypothetical protein Tco_1502846 [Tanacetum coccineum]
MPYLAAPAYMGVEYYARTLGFPWLDGKGLSFNSYAKAVLGNKSVDMSGKYGTSNAGAECGGVGLILAKVKDLSVISELLKHMSSEGFDDVGLRICWRDVGVWFVIHAGLKWESVKNFKGSNPLERKDAEGPSWMKVFENEEHLMSIVVDSDSPKKLTMIRCRLLVGFAERRMFMGWKVFLVDSFEEARFDE